jgi:hypothetical protein
MDRCHLYSLGNQWRIHSFGNQRQPRKLFQLQCLAACTRLQLRSHMWYLTPWPRLQLPNHPPCHSHRSLTMRRHGRRILLAPWPPLCSLPDPPSPASQTEHVVLLVPLPGCTWDMGEEAVCGHYSGGLKGQLTLHQCAQHRIPFLLGISGHRQRRPISSWLHLLMSFVSSISGSMSGEIRN